MAGPGTRDSPRLSIITVNYRVTDLLRGMLASIPDSVAGVPYETIVVDNASHDGSLNALQSDHADVRVIESPANLGFARGNNLGVSQARGEYLAFVNPDVVLERGSLRSLVDFLATHPGAGLVGPKIVLADGATQSSAGELPTKSDFLRSLPGTRFWHGAVFRRQSAVDRPVSCGFVHGAAMVMPRAAFDRIGGIPTVTFMYGEELLLGHRLRSAGLEVWYDPSVTVRHSEESSANRSFDSYDKALRKRWAHTIARAEILPLPSFFAWNSVMAARALASAARATLSGSSAHEHYVDLIRLHVRAFGTLTPPSKVEGPPSPRGPE